MSRKLRVREFSFRCFFYLGAASFIAVQVLFVVSFMALYRESIFNQLTRTSALLPEEILTTMEEYSREISNSRTSVTYVPKRRRPTQIKVPERQTETQTFDTVEGCSITNEVTLSAINRATSPSCKNLIYKTACAIQQGRFYPTSLPHSCPSGGRVYGKYLGCYRDDQRNRRLQDGSYTFRNDNSQTKCIDQCIELGYPYAGVEFGTECFCGNELPSNQSRISESFCNMKCPANQTENCGGLLALNVFETGIGSTVYQPRNDDVSRMNTTNPPVRIAFFMMLNGRDLRQVMRLFKMLYHRDHYFFIHVDKRQEYMFRGLVGLERIFQNVRLARTRRSPVWGSASLSTTLLEGMTEIVRNRWHFDFLINLSESDFPLQTTEKLEAFLWSNRDRNFVGTPLRPDINVIDQQGGKKTFVECDNHMWLIGDREYPRGIAYQAGSDWFVFSRVFVHYLATVKNDTLLNGLKVLHEHTLMSAETFFQIFTRNSAFCVTRVNENLRSINWKRNYGCQCQQKPIVDWCGCSPNVFVADDWPRLRADMSNYMIFFGRKFEATICQSIINSIEEKVYNRHWGENGRRYWHNIYHHVETEVDETVIQFCSSLSRRALQTFAQDNSSTFDPERSKVLQVFSYHEDDVQRGILVHFEAIDSKNSTVQIEAWYDNGIPFTLYNINLSSRFVRLQVGTEYDVKERILRNRLGVIGPFSQPVLMYEVAKGTEIFEVGVVWLDPTQSMAATSTIHSISPFAEVHHLEANLNLPLVSGVWEVFLVRDSAVLARVPFLVVPAHSEYAGMRKLLPKTYDLPSTKFMVPVIKLLHNVYNPMTKTADRLKNESYVGSERIKFIDDLTKSMYPLIKLCYIPLRSEDTRTEYYKLNVPYCRTSNWSSFSPDPKSQVSTVNEKTGRLNF